MKTLKQYRLAIVAHGTVTPKTTIHHVLSYSLKDALSINVNAVAISWKPAMGVVL